MTLRLVWAYGNHLSVIIDCGLVGIGANRSMTTLRGGGGNLRPEIDMNLRPTGGMNWLNELI